MSSETEPIRKKTISVVRVVVGWLLTVVIALAFAFTVYVLTQVSQSAMIVAVFLVLLPFAALQYLALLVLHPPSAAVRASIRGALFGGLKARPISSLMRPRFANVAMVCLYLAVTLYLNTPSAVEGMDEKSVVVTRQIPIALQMPLLSETGLLEPLVKGFGEVAAYAVLVAIGALLLYLAVSIVAYVLVISLHFGKRIVLILARWHKESLTKSVGNDGKGR